MRAPEPSRSIPAAREPEPKRPGLWSPDQTAALAAAASVASAAASEVAADAAATVTAAVDVAAKAAAIAAAKARDVAAEAVSVAAEAAHDGTAPESRRDSPTGTAHTAEAGVAAARVAQAVASVAEAAATAAVDAAALIGDQLAHDVAAIAAAVAAASGQQTTPELVHRPLARRPDGDARLAGQLSTAISDDQLRLHYQPILSVATGRPVGVEALLRWQHPDRGLLPAQEFIHVAERDELILRLGELVLHEACSAAVRVGGRAGSALTVAVNLSARQLSDGSIVETVGRALGMSGCSANRLVFELTETAPVTDMRVAVRSLRGLKELGVGLAIDDFGTGYSTLQYLMELPVDLLKIDRAFIAALGSPHGGSLVESVVSLAHNVNVQCVAEGVETAAQLAALEQLGCDFVQGYFFSPPVDEPTLTAWLDARPSRHALPFSPETARILRMCQLGSSFQTVAAALNSEGSRTSRDRRWSAESVAWVVASAQRAADVPRRLPPRG
ncbi:MAG: hypothetical protein JWP11_2203 [Frankiales bacterium]|nr:hypothetical protein [Frankiales bacterium]